jgi:hypothetical protein
VQLGHHQWLVHVGVDEVNQHLVADTQRELHAPVGPGQRLGRAHSSAAAGVVGGVALGSCVCSRLRQAARIRPGAALPGELHLDRVVALGAQLFTGQAHD